MGYRGFVHGHSLMGAKRPTVWKTSIPHRRHVVNLKDFGATPSSVPRRTGDRGGPQTMFRRKRRGGHKTSRREVGKFVITKPISHEEIIEIHSGENRPSSRHEGSNILG